MNEQPRILRADGVEPGGAGNHYFWPMVGDQWWPGHTKELYHIDSRFHFEIIALEDGRFSCSNWLPEIEKGSTWPMSKDDVALPVVFKTRKEAIRTAAARMLRTARSARHWEGIFYRLSYEHFTQLYNWTLQRVAEETDDKPGRMINLSEPPKPGIEKDLELWKQAKVC